jgi:hypothetical protein
VFLRNNSLVMPGLVPGIHALAASGLKMAWMAGTSPAMTKRVVQRLPNNFSMSASFNSI